MKNKKRPANLVDLSEGLDPPRISPALGKPPKTNPNSGANATNQGAVRGSSTQGKKKER